MATNTSVLHVPGSYFWHCESIPTATRHTRRYEVYFPHTFTTSHPYETTPPELEDSTNALEIPVEWVSHVTHNKEASAIGEFQEYIFKPAPKFGKCYRWDVSSMAMGETYKLVEDKPTNRSRANYMEVPFTNKVLPGSLSWWGISPREWENDDLTLRRSRMNGDVSDYLRLPPQSRYGNNEFRGKLSDMFECYKRSRKVENVYLVIGGTLRYRREICYVVIVCTRNDLRRDLRHFPRLSESNQPILKLNGLVDSTGKGKVVNPDAVPVFVANHISPKLDSRGWEMLTFAFYFEDHSNSDLKCAREVIHREEIVHTTDLCRSKIQAIRYRPWICPNDRDYYIFMYYFSLFQNQRN